MTHHMTGKKARSNVTETCSQAWESPLKRTLQPPGKERERTLTGSTSGVWTCGETYSHHGDNARGMLELSMCVSECATRMVGTKALLLWVSSHRMHRQNIHMYIYTYVQIHLCQFTWVVHWRPLTLTSDCLFPQHRFHMKHNYCTSVQGSLARGIPSAHNRISKDKRCSSQFPW